MTLMVFFGCVFIAFGPSMAIFVFTVMKHPLRIILLVIGAFFWLLSLLFSALLWLAVVPLKQELAFSLVFSVIFQEAFRFALFKLLNKAESGLDEALTDEEKHSISGHKLPYVSGFGFGLMYGLFSIVNVLSSSIGPGNVGKSEHFFLISAFLTNCFILLHLFWNIIAFHALKHNSYYKAFLVLLCHMFTSCLSLLNLQQNTSFVAVLIDHVVLVVVALWAFFTVGGSFRNVKTSFSCQS
uniref:Gamma-secretase subunit Aph-1b-like n=1 Tax=Phallusia mammillata TaxID=59560 RepID=A0A6F9D5U7_9ASCI|nr:gamma-secretase subunit Aph-1b-like [Phallusia mammillata]